MNIYGTTPEYLDCPRLGRPWTKGRCSPTATCCQRQQGLRDRRNAGPRVVSAGIADRQGYSHAKRLVARRRRVEPQRGEHDGHGSGRHRHRAVDHDQVSRAGKQCAKRQSKRRRSRRRHDPIDTGQHAQQFVPRRSGAVSRPPRPSSRPTRRRRCGLPTSTRFWSKARSAAAIPSGHRPDHRHCCANATGCGPIKTDDFNIRDMTEITKAMTSHFRFDEQLAADRGADFAVRRRRGDHEHHAGVGHRADPRNRLANGRRRHGRTTSCGSS